MTYKTLHKKLKRQYNDLKNTTQETKYLIRCEEKFEDTKVIFCKSKVHNNTISLNISQYNIMLWILLAVLYLYH
jgi:hypothetical protein